MAVITRTKRLSKVGVVIALLKRSNKAGEATTLLRRSSRAGVVTMLQMEQEIVLTLNKSEVLLTVLKKQMQQKVLEILQKLSQAQRTTMLVKKQKGARKPKKGALAAILTRELSKAEVVTTKLKIDLPETDPERRLGLPNRQRCP